ncbi:MAG: hypothetical protein M3546_12350 [Actinomycetota bacterium]|nr:hypothetical protein [Actinomycetota bacterium]
MRRAGLLALVLIGLAFPAGLGLAMYVASGSSLVPPALSSRVPTGEIARPSTPPTVTSALADDTSTDEVTTTDTTTEGDTAAATTTDDDSESGRGRGRGRGRSGDD